jgi:hypothetical protein
MKLLNVSTKTKGYRIYRKPFYIFGQIGEGGVLLSQMAGLPMDMEEKMLIGIWSRVRFQKTTIFHNELK